MAVGAAGLGIGLFLLAGGGEDAGTFPATRTDTLQVPADARTLCLRRRFVLEGSLELREGGRRLVPGADYALDADAGCLVLVNPEVGAGTLLVATYRVPPIRLDPVYRLEEDPARRRPPVPGPAPGAPPPRPFTGAGETSGLDVSGSKTFGVEVGNRRDLKLRQSLDLRVTGQVGSDVSLLAILSDQDVPFQPEGSTAELEELDRVLVEIRGPRAAVGLGDVEIGQTGTAYLDFDRRLEGLLAETRWGGGGTRGAVASAKGEFTSVEFLGADGRQGPYRLPDRGGGTGVVVVAGTERVWLDGEPLRRGAEEDYVIDYSVGEITFTTRRTITANSRITADYEVATTRYRRRLLAAGSESIPLGVAGTLRASVLSERDDPDDPFAGELGADERTALAALGDSVATVSGGTAYVGPGLGDYDLVADPESGRDVFVYVAGAGDYRVAFLAVGTDQGDYAKDEEESTPGFTVFRFVGAGRGDHVVRRDLGAPRSLVLGGLRWDASGRGGRFAAEGAVSEADLNTLSALDDGDNDGHALLVEGRGAAWRPGGGWSLAPQARWRSVSGGFAAPGRVRDGFYGRDWNLPDTAAVGEEELGEVALDAAWSERFSWHADAARFAAADTFRAVRQRQRAGWSDRWIDAAAEWVTTRETGGDAGSRGSLDRASGSASVVRWPVVPRVRLAGETRRPAGEGGGDRYREWEAALGVPLPLGTMRAEIGAGERDDEGRDSLGAPWAPVRDARRLFFSSSGSVRTLSLLLRYEARTDDAPEAERERRDLGRLDLRHDAFRGAWNAVVAADLGSVGLRRRPKIIEADSTGYFDEFGNYVGAGGGYDVRYESPGAETLTSRLDLTTRLRWSPRGGEPGVPPLFRRVAWEGFANLVEATTLPLGTPRYLFSPGSYLDRDHTLDGRLRVRQTFDVNPAAADVGGRLRLETSRRLVRNEETAEGSLLEISGEREVATSVRWNPRPEWNLEVEGSLGDRTSEVATGGGSASRLVTDLRTGTVRAGYRLGDGAGGGRLAAEAAHSDEEGGGRKAAGWVLRPRLAWTFPARGRLDLRYALTVLTVRRGFPALRGPGAPTLTEGWRVDLVGDVRIREGLNLTATLVVDRPTGFGTVTEGRMEARGTF